MKIAQLGFIFVCVSELWDLFLDLGWCHGVNGSTYRQKRWTEYLVQHMLTAIAINLSLVLCETNSRD